MAKETFIIRTEWKEAIFELPESDQAIIFRNLFNFHSGLEIELPNLQTKLVWKLIQPNLIRNIESYDKRTETSANNGKLGGRPRKEENLNNLTKKPNNLTEPIETLSVSVSVNDSVSVNVNDISNTEKIENPNLGTEATGIYQKPESGSHVVKWCLNKLNQEIDLAYTSPTTIDETKLPEWFSRFSRVHPTVQKVKIHRAFIDFGNTILASGEHNDIPKTLIENKIKNHFINKFNKANGK